jgi:gamma-butyrobetaine dioxygenase
MTLQREAPADSLRAIAGVTRRDDRVELTWGDGSTSTFHHLWLRDNCPCPSCRHPSVPERLIDTQSIPEDVAPANVEVSPEGDLVVVWSGDAHRSEFDTAWLAEHAYDDGPRWSGDDRQMWSDGSPMTPPEIEYEAIIGSDGGLLDWLEQIRTFGVSFVRHAPTVPGTVAAIAERIAFRRNSNFGLLWDVVSKPDPDSLAYTAHGLPPHVDLVSRQAMPGVQFLHCLVFEATGGDTLLVDGFACAAELARSDPESFELLTTTPLLWRYRDGADTDLSYRGPMIRVGPSGAVEEVRCSNTLLAPLDVPPDRTLDTYRAVRAFVGIVRSGRFEIRVRLQPGDVMCFDNYRILHGRTEFDPNSGHRHLQGCYIDRDDFLSRIRTLEAGSRR